MAATPAPVRGEHQDALRQLERVLRHYQGFQILLLLYNDPPAYRDSLIAYLDRSAARPARLDVRSCPDFADFEQRLAEQAQDADWVQVIGFDAWLPLATSELFADEAEAQAHALGVQRLHGFNLRREALAQACPKPLLLWLPAHLASPLARHAPDFWEWRRALLDFSVALQAAPVIHAASANLAPIALELPAELADAAQPWSHARFNVYLQQIQAYLDQGQVGPALAYAQALQRRSMAAGEGAYAGADYDLAWAIFMLGHTLGNAGFSEAALDKLRQAQQRFDAIVQGGENPAAAYMAALALGEQGDCLRNLGRFEEAASIYGESIRRSEQRQDRHQAATAKGQLGTVRRHQRRYPEALAIYREALEVFSALDEPGAVADIQHLIGIVHQEMGHYAAAEQAYRQALALHVRLGNPIGQADVMVHLGGLYRTMGRLEDTVAFCRQALDRYMDSGNVAKEGVTRSNLADTLYQLGRLEQARTEIQRAIDCKVPYGYVSEPWKSWNILQQIESAAGRPEAAESARQKALEAFLAYRRDGGENHYGSGRLCSHIGDRLLAGQRDEAKHLLESLRSQPGWRQSGLPLLEALAAIAGGARDPALADDPALAYDQAAEIRLLLERLRIAQPIG